MNGSTRLPFRRMPQEQPVCLQALERERRSTYTPKTPTRNPRRQLLTGKPEKKKGLHSLIRQIIMSRRLESILSPARAIRFTLGTILSSKTDKERLVARLTLVQLALRKVVVHFHAICVLAFGSGCLVNRNEGTLQPLLPASQVFYSCCIHRRPFLRVSCMPSSCNPGQFWLHLVFKRLYCPVHL